MKKLKFIFRLLTPFCYFLPFVFCHSTCVRGEYKTAYNKQEAFANEAEANLEKISELGSQAENLKPYLTGPDRTLKIDSFKTHIFRSLTVSFEPKELIALTSDSADVAAKELMYTLVAPNNYSFSGLGAVFQYKNTYGSIIVSVSLLLSLLTLILWRLLKRKNISLYILSLNFILLAIILADSVISEIDLLWGFWLLFILILFQLSTEIFERKKKHIIPQS